MLFLNHPQKGNPIKNSEVMRNLFCHFPINANGKSKIVLLSVIFHAIIITFYSCENLIIKPGERKLISTGVQMAIPQGYVGLFWDKSGLATKFGIETMAGVIDAGYRGEIKVLLHNLGEKEFKIEKKMKIAQMLIQPIELREIIEVKEKKVIFQKRSTFKEPIDVTEIEAMIPVLSKLLERFSSQVAATIVEIAQ